MNENEEEIKVEIKPKKKRIRAKARPVNPQIQVPDSPETIRARKQAHQLNLRGGK